MPHLEFLLGEGRVVAPKTVEVRLAAGGTRTFAAERLFLNLGTHAAVPEIPGLAAAAPLTHVEALELGRLPSHPIVLGGGYVGVELAQAVRRLGSKVTILQRGSQLLDREDAGIELDARGYIKVDDRLQTTAASVWAVGECAGSPHFTHVAFDDFRVVRDNLAGKPRSEGLNVLLTSIPAPEVR